MREIDRIIIHCSATRPDWMSGAPLAEQVAEIRRWHVDGNRWRDIGYHWVMGRVTGGVIAGRPEHETGAHVRGFNAGSIGICLIGGHGSSAWDAFEDHFTGAQAGALTRFVGELQAKYPGATIHGHNEFAAKACPGFSVPDFFGERPRAPAKIGQRMLGRGDIGNDVRDLQHLLRRAARSGDASTSLMRRTGSPSFVDGAYGPLTQAAVLEFQKWQGLVEDGIAGPVTVEALRKVVE
ncbi:MAG: peptidoglycan recognition protein family protein [Mycobacterium sp.]